MNDDLIDVIGSQQRNADDIERTATAEPSNSLSTILSGDSLRVSSGYSVSINHLYVSDGGRFGWQTGDGDLIILSET